ncbi:PHB depolymerase family esterase [Mycobacterium sp. EPa45]|uniref:extracellular catalytic domain type 1 short-chain-length polyhydroxyalkanoate depolymerase n=1 Tax=Mycobacterium sp. EPa45 TaxID=1545728 RepID=UPI000641FF95|nr:PHB depolymerase family esterase [Mycobacterium sp. EPa45]AKK27568.1 polyhydroxybutyrate depolymerase [Mycobacterium sp. EPa45]
MPTRVVQMLAIGAVVLVAGGCLGGAQATGTPGQSTQSLSVGGATRSFHIYRPDGLSGAAPLVVMLHGGYGDGAQAERAYHWDAQADSGHFVVAYPDGLDRAWNAGSCCGRPARSGVDDVAFLTAMVGAIEQQIPIDTTRVFVTGMSNGAMMALRLACQSTLFAAVASVAGTLLAGCSNPSPTSLMQIHGTADDRVPYDGGPGKALTAAGSPRVDGPSVESVNAQWRTINGCAPPVSSSSGDVRTTRADCPDGRSVELIAVAGAGHQWPGGVPNPVVEKIAGLPPPSTALDATATIWQFFAAHARSS